MDYKTILNRFKDKNILIIGDLILDHYVWGVVNRISPEAPVPVVDVQSENYLLGGSGNVADNIISLGASVSIVGIVGNDHHGEILTEMLIDKKINIQGVSTDLRPTTIKSRVIANGQHIVRFDKEQRHDITVSLFESITGFISDNIKLFDAVIISDYEKGVITPELMNFLLSTVAPVGLFIGVDPKIGHFHYYTGVSLITPNKKEASEGSGVHIIDENSLLDAAKIFMERLDCAAVLITRGDEGMSLFFKDEIHHISTTAKEVYDVTGAGDTVIATFTLARVSGAGMLEAAVIANHAAGIVVSEMGAASATVDEILNSLNGQTLI